MVYYLDYVNNEDDYVIYDMISTNSNDHPPQYSMTIKRVVFKTLQYYKRK